MLIWLPMEWMLCFMIVQLQSKTQIRLIGFFLLDSFCTRFGGVFFNYMYTPYFKCVKLRKKAKPTSKLSLIVFSSVKKIAIITQIKGDGPNYKIWRKYSFKYINYLISETHEQQSDKRQNIFEAIGHIVLQHYFVSQNIILLDGKSSFYYRIETCN